MINVEDFDKVDMRVGTMIDVAENKNKTEG